MTWCAVPKVALTLAVMWFTPGFSFLGIGTIIDHYFHRIYTALKLFQTPGLSFLIKMPVLGSPASPSSNSSTGNPCHVFL